MFIWYSQASRATEDSVNLFSHTDWYSDKCNLCFQISEKCPAEYSSVPLPPHHQAGVLFGSTTGFRQCPWSHQVHAVTSARFTIRLVYLYLTGETVCNNLIGTSWDQTMPSSHMIFPFLCISAKHYTADTTEPISCGLQTLEELLSWKRSEANPFNVAAVPLAPREPPLASCPRRTLVSHDMMGGYLDDRCAMHF